MAVIGVIGGLLGEFFFFSCYILGSIYISLTVSFLMAFSSRGIIQPTYILYDIMASKLFAQERKSSEGKDSHEMLHFLGYVYLLKIDCLVSELK